MTLTPVGLFGGTFNPFHKGHLEIIKSAQKEMNFAPLIVMPCGIPPHKSAPIPDKNQRLKMVELGCKNITNVEVWNYEIEKDSPSYTYNTLLYVQKKVHQHPLFLILGSDSFLNLRKWHKGDQIPKLTHVLIALRAKTQLEDFIQLNDFIELKKIFDRHKKIIKFLKASVTSISSSELRSDPSKQKQFIQPNILNFLKKEGLYVSQSPSETKTVMKTTDKNSTKRKTKPKMPATKKPSAVKTAARPLKKLPLKSTKKTSTPPVDNALQSMALSCAKAVIDKKALHTLILQVGASGGFTEYFLISSGTNERQVQAMADEAVGFLKKAGIAPKVEGYDDGRWILVDGGFILLHLFHEEIRKFYNLEELWIKAPRVAIPEEYFLGPSKG